MKIRSLTMTNARPTAKPRLKAPGVGLCTCMTTTRRVWVGETIDIYAAVCGYDALFHNVYTGVHGCPRPCSRIPYESSIFFVLPTRVARISRRRYPYGKFFFFSFCFRVFAYTDSRNLREEYGAQ